MSDPSVHGPTRTALLNAVSADAIAEAIVGVVTDSFGCETVAFAMLLAEGNRVLEVALHTDVPADAAAPWHRFSSLRALPIPHVLRTRMPVFIDGGAEYAEFFPEGMEGSGIRAMAILPLMADGRVLGAIALEFAEPRRFTEAERELLIVLAGQATQALDRARRLQAQGQTGGALELVVDGIARLQSLAATLSGAATPRQAAEIALEQGMLALGAIGGGVSLVLPNGREQALVAIRAPDVSTDQLEGRTSFPLDGPYPVNEAVQQRRLIEVESYEEFSSRWPELASRMGSAEHQAYIAVPLEVGDRVIGGMSYAFAQRRRISPEQRAFIATLARLAGQAIERARLFEQEHAARALAEQANRAKSDFIAVMSHELRTPLNAISGYIDLMLAGVHGPLPALYEKYAERIQAAQKHLLGLVDSVLRFAKVESGQVTYSIATHSVAELLRGLDPLVEPQARARGVTLVIEPADPSLNTRADNDKVTQILLNLITNAIKYTDAGGTIMVSAARAGHTVAIRVIDTGRGIPPDRLDRIFEPFVQIEASLANEIDGVGLGLAISRDLARAMGGELEVTSAVGQGSNFTLRLPSADLSLHHQERPLGGSK